MKIGTIFCFLLLMHHGGIDAAEKTSSFDYLYSEEAIKDVISGAEFVVVAQIQSIQPKNSVTPNGDIYSSSSTLELVVSQPLRGYSGRQGDKLNLDIPNAYVEYLDTFMSVAEYEDFIARNKQQTIQTLLDKHTGFLELKDGGEISDSVMNLITSSFDLSYQAISGVGDAHVFSTPLVSHESSIADRKFLVSEGDICLILLSRKLGSLGILNENSYGLYPSAEYAIYKDVEMAYVRSIVTQ